MWLEVFGCWVFVVFVFVGGSVYAQYSVYVDFRLSLDT
jgi:hypothetical protein